MKIFLDDTRNPPDYSWVLVRSPIVFKELIRAAKDDAITAISFDHDLGCFDTKIEREITGADCAAYVISRMLDGHRPLAAGCRLTVHSANPVGAKRILGYIADIERISTPSV